MKAILACDESWCIGSNGILPWPPYPEDLQWFKTMTSGKTVIMGRGTWDSPSMPSPLPNRRNIVITSNKIDGVECYSIDELKDKSKNGHLPKDPYIIGGSGLFHEMLPYIDELLLSRVKGSFDGDTYLDEAKIKQHLRLYGASVALSGLHIEIWRKK